MSDSRSSGSGGIGFASALTLIFIVLKLTDNIDWSWWLVLSPTLASIGLVVGILAIGALFVMGVALSDRWKRRSSRKWARKSQELER